MPLIKMQAHSAPLGLAFYTAGQFPQRYHGLFVAFHGSWNRSVPTGYKVVYIPLNGRGEISGPAQDFATGWLLDNNDAEAVPSVWRLVPMVHFMLATTKLASSTASHMGVSWRVVCCGLASSKATSTQLSKIVPVAAGDQAFKKPLTPTHSFIRNTRRLFCPERAE